MLRILTKSPSLLVLLLAVLLAGCSGSGRARYESPKEAFDKGKAFFDEGDFAKAIELLQGTFDFGRTHQWAADAQLFLARSYRGNSEFLLAANEFTRFTQIYRSDPRIPDAEYELAMTYYDRSPIFRLDQTDTERAIIQFQLFMTRHSDHPLVGDAAGRIIELRSKLATKQFNTAELYAKREYFGAAAVSYEAVFDRYYDTDLADDALLGALQSYYDYARLSVQSKMQERLRLAEANYDRLVQIFPDSPLLKQAEDLYLQVQALMDPTSVTS